MSHYCAFTTLFTTQKPLKKGGIYIFSPIYPEKRASSMPKAVLLGALYMKFRRIIGVIKTDGKGLPNESSLISPNKRSRKENRYLRK